MFSLAAACLKPHTQPLLLLLLLLLLGCPHVYFFCAARYEDESSPEVCRALEAAARSFMFDCDGTQLEVEEQQEEETGAAAADAVGAQDV
jgi:hypothetical protein